MKFALLSFVFLSFCALAQAQTQIQPPKIDYAKYGSLDAQLRVYEAAQRKVNQLELERYRAFRAEIARTTPTTTLYVVGDRGSYSSIGGTACYRPNYRDYVPNRSFGYVYNPYRNGCPVAQPRYCGVGFRK